MIGAGAEPGDEPAAGALVLPIAGLVLADTPAARGACTEVAGLCSGVWVPVIAGVGVPP
jgi:hypothetical protein